MYSSSTANSPPQVHAKIPCLMLVAVCNVTFTCLLRVAACKVTFTCPMLVATCNVTFTLTKRRSKQSLAKQYTSNNHWCLLSSSLIQRTPCGPVLESWTRRVVWWLPCLQVFASFYLRFLVSLKLYTCYRISYSLHCMRDRT